MGQNEPGRDAIGRDGLAPERVGADRAPITVEDLESWEEHGAMWRAVEVSDDNAVVELCTCYGEPVDLVQGHAPELIEFVRARRASG